MRYGENKARFVLKTNQKVSSVEHFTLLSFTKQQCIINKHYLTQWLKISSSGQGEGGSHLQCKHPKVIKGGS